MLYRKSYIIINNHSEENQLVFEMFPIIFVKHYNCIYSINGQI